MAVVRALTVWAGPAAGVVVGVLQSGAAFVRGMNRSLVRSRYDVAARPSRRIDPPDLEALLGPQRRRIVVLELEGAVFFGSAERLADEAEAIPADSRCLVLDVRRVSSIDDSGAMTIALLRRRLARRGIALLLAHVEPQGDRHHRLHISLSPGTLFGEMAMLDGQGRTADAGRCR